MEPDWDELQAVGTELVRLEQAGRLDRMAYERLYARAKKAAAGHGQLLEFVANFRPM